MEKKHRIKKQIFLLCLRFIFFYYIFFITDAFAQLEVYLSVRAGGSSLLGVGIGGFESLAESSLIYSVRNTLEGDLNKSGLFEVKALSDSLANLPGDLFGQWKAAGAMYFLSGEETDNGNSIRVKLFNLNTAVTLLSEKYLIDNNRPWYTAHVIVDDMIELVTGLRGSMASQIAFIRTVRGNRELFLIDADGRNPRQLTFSKTFNLSPSWSADGNTIAYSSLSGNNWLLMTINITTGQSKTISNWQGLNTTPDWSPANPDVVAFTSTRDGNAEIYTCRINSRGIRRLTNHRRIDSSPSWSPDGSKIAFSSDRTGKPLIYIMKSDGTNTHRLTSTPSAYEDSPCWSPRGSRILFVIMSDYGFEIATSSPDGDDVVMLTFGQGSNEDPHWSPDGLRIVFTSSRTGSKKLYIMNWDGSNVRPLTIDGYSFSPAWAPAVSGNDIRVTSKR